MVHPDLQAQGRRLQIRLLLLAAAGAVAIGAAVLVGLRQPGAPPAISRDAGRTAAPVASKAQPSTEAPKPSFDIVRVDPKGGAVIAGHATPGAEVRVEADGREIGRTRAGQDGAWVLVPAAPLPPGGRALSLTERTDQGRESRSEGSVLVVVPAPGEEPQALAVLSRPAAPPRVLQGAGAAGSGPSLEAAEFDESGDVELAGRAPPGATVRVYIDEQAAGDAVANAEGRWSLAPGLRLAPGDHRVRLDQLGANGEVVARAAAPLPREARAGGQLPSGRVTVQRGQSLWTLARQAYGSGVRYTVIYQANRGQIHDPSRIYPGQVFSLPANRPAR
jgi:nucleoid-associated protein YgaU